MGTLLSCYRCRMTHKDQSEIGLLSIRERDMLSEYKAMMHRTCLSFWRSDYERAQKRVDWVRPPQTGNLAKDTRSLMITLATDPFLTDISAGTAFQRKGRSGWAGRLWPNQRWMLPSPFDGRRFMTQEILCPSRAKFNRLDWIKHRDPSVYTLTLHHIEIETNEDSPFATLVIAKELAALKRRWNKLLPEIIDSFR